MKRTFIAVLILLAGFAAMAQPYVDVINPNTTGGQTPGDVFVTVYVSAPGCGGIIDQTVPIQVSPSASTYSIDLGLSATWSSGMVPVGYDFAYATVSRNPACAASIGTWGAYNHSSLWPTDYYWEEVLVGDPGCGYTTYKGFLISLSGGGSCNGMIDGEYHQVDLTFPGGTTLAQIEVIHDPTR